MDVVSGGCVAYYVCQKCGRTTDPLVMNVLAGARNDSYTDKNEPTLGTDDV